MNEQSDGKLLATVLLLQGADSLFKQVTCMTFYKQANVVISADLWNLARPSSLWNQELQAALWPRRLPSDLQHTETGITTK